ncbi:acyl carrier protein [Candidatus Pacearchaeota archaeon CG10_big_fil_rev_8_21_14_0_10_35_219]|nr:MAG: hypothetical protein AUJ63_05010 [Candidatus Pacearchaeota archaeon CG1_02_35_32]PIO07254.1 MAG: acyl carrier protein [Candidatus Pacearchaeota archaeon CG10_big_fil_rev_8_21_14_0_10_35_219]PIY81177.1 MAG: acyl carrier protein [Candidatus Pacearchaeota archaeon CG_4_10_14_0_8_um_filter_35_169]PIZ79429.1 MAG: acyl carrier protein [Candidatus Pacearchaeota archaeon CG_4_10_14_0_2_um_filter_35_33]PJB94584.1 MAG: acyl carrier protein [Candidatus Pacearchaeota archaeon CG_4_9_14_0_8_um_filte
MEDTKIRQKVEKFIKKTFLLGEEGNLPHDKSLTKGEIVDSIGIIELIDFISSEFNITIPDNLLTPENLDSIESIVKLIKKILAGK